jgi:hypothetical protein
MYTPNTDRMPDDAIMHNVTATRTIHAGWMRDESVEGGVMVLR